MKTLYLVDANLTMVDWECKDSAQETRVRVAAKMHGVDVFDTKTDALTAIELCRDQARKNQSRELT